LNQLAERINKKTVSGHVTEIVNALTWKRRARAFHSIHVKNSNAISKLRLIEIIMLKGSNDEIECLE